MKKLLAVSLLISALALSACASSSSDPSDPLETVNRATFKFNDAVDTAVLEPVAKAYRASVPQPARTGVRNVLTNLKSPMVIANETLQGDVTGAFDATTRLVVNSLLGVGGVFDVAGAGGLKAADEDFGQTLGVWGVGPGPYLVLPLMGPSSVRDASGIIVDNYFDPLNLWLDNTGQDEWMIARVGVATIDKREELLNILADLKKNSVDYYASMRSTYSQRRDALIRDNNGDAASLPEM